MTLSTSEVAVCCSSASVSSRVRAHLIEQPHVLDRDHRLIGKGGDKLDLLLGKGITSVRVKNRTPIGVPSRRSGTPSVVR